MTVRALVIEPNLSGHRWRYVEWTLETLREAGYECTLSTDVRNFEHPLIQSYRSGRSAISLSWLEDDPGPSTALRAFLARVKDEFAFHALFASVYRSVAETQPVHLVVVPYGDYILKSVALLGSPFSTTPWVCITMRQSFHLHQMGVKVPRRRYVDFVNKHLFVRALRNGSLKAVLSIDPTLARWHASSPYAALRTRVDYLPDPFPEVNSVEKARAKTRLGIDAQRSILVYGAISERKGVIELLNACLALDAHPLVIIAGEQDETVRAYLRSFRAVLDGRVRVFDHFIPAQMETDLFSACDVVWVGYKHHYGMSGVLVQAHRFRRIVIATSAGLIGWFAKHDQMGPLLPNLLPSTIGAAIKSAIYHCEWNIPFRCIEDDTRMLAQNTLHGFKQALAAAISTDRPSADVNHPDASRPVETTADAQARAD
ncbi:group 1 glycosyl transferase [Trinickia symbiotica]|uniref:Group 1 glycosyl transferase n=1 Tax=Trinickia symbiotica TaxID=863227 RepID=A0A2T3XVN5_9BURK|nr:group 1 glycosyl transferase [Trinickia symbiotica]PTB20580.1 group 1 glycosyl transferase [Trinickia symbiotica]